MKRTINELYTIKKPYSRAAKKPKFSQYKFEVELNKKIYKTFQNGQLTSNWLHLCTTHLNDFSAINISTALHLASKKELKNRLSKKQFNLCEDLAEAFLKISHKANPGSLARVTRSLSFLEIKNRKLMNKIATVTIEKIERFSAKNLSLLSQGFSKLGINNSTLFSEIAEQTLEIIEDLDPQSLLGIGESFTQLNIKNTNLYNELFKESYKKIKTFTEKQLNIFLYMLSKQNFPNFKYIDAIVDNLKIETASKYFVADLIFSLSKLGYNRKRTFERLSKRALKKIDCYSEKNLTKIVWASSKSKGLSEELFEKALQKLKSISEFKLPCTIPHILWSLTRLGRSDLAFFKKTCKQVPSLLPKLNSLHLSNLAWALSIQGLFPDLIEDIITEIESRNHSLTFKEYNQIYQAELALRLLFGRKANPKREEMFLSLSKRLYPPKSSTLHKEISSLLQEMNYNPQDEVFESSFYLDIVLDQENKYAIEVDGKTHSEKHRKLSDQFREKILTAQGWTIVHITSTDWDILKKQNPPPKLLKKRRTFYLKEFVLPYFSKLK